MTAAASELTIAAESPLSDDMRDLLLELNKTLLGLTPSEYCYHMTAEEMAGPETTVFVAREGSEAVACGAFCRHGAGVGEVKRMYTRPRFQGMGIGAAILDRIEAEARKSGVTRLVLETGSNFEAAASLYEKAGFVACGPVLDYKPSKWTAFFEKSLFPSSGERK